MADTNYKHNYPSSLSGHHIANDQYRNNEAARTGFFSLRVNGLNEIYKSTTTYTDPNKAPKPTAENAWMTAEDNLELHVVKFFEPDFTITPLNYTRGNEVVKFAGKPEWQGGDLVVDDVIGMHTYEILQAWLFKAYNPFTQKGGRMSDYKFTATLTQYTQDYEEVRTWTLYGVWISGLSSEGFDKENDGKRQVTAKFEYDWALPEKLEN